MKLKFKKQPYQTHAVESVADCFAGQPKNSGIKRVVRKLGKNHNLFDISDDLKQYRGCISTYLTEVAPLYPLAWARGKNRMSRYPK